MFVDYKVKPINKKDTEDYLLNIHYAKRVPPIQYAYGLFYKELLVGCVTFAPPASPQVAKGFVGSDNKQYIIELNRLCLRFNRKNEASFLVGNALNLLPKPLMVVSYADSAHNHVGYIYQATNFLYCGAATSHDSEYLIDGKKVHPRTLAARGITSPKKWAKENGVPSIEPKPKYRYVFLCGDKREKKFLRSILRYGTLPYPKGGE